MSEPVARTKRRRWRVVAYFDVDATPDPAYDVSAHERLADALTHQIEEALGPHLNEIEIDEVMCVDN